MKKLYLLLLSINLLGVAAAHSEEALSVSSSPIKGALHLLQGRVAMWSHRSGPTAF